MSIAPPPVVSVIIATYNWSSVLRYAIQSVLWQTLQDFELLVIGDACTDDSAEIVASFADPRVRWHNLPQNSGNQSAPNNAGLQLARGRYVAYLGHDDLWHPSHLATLVAALNQNGADFGVTLTEVVGPPGSGIRGLWGVSATGRYASEGNAPPSSLMHRRSMADELGGWLDYRQLHRPHDRDFMNRAFEQGKSSVSVNVLTVFKFPSAWRPNSYREKRSDEQAEYARRIPSEPDFVTRELVAVASAYALGRGADKVKMQMPERPANAPPGWTVEQWRRIRGLAPNELAPVPPLHRSPTRLLTDPLRAILRHVLQWLGN